MSKPDALVLWFHVHLLAGSFDHILLDIAWRLKKDFNGPPLLTREGIMKKYLYFTVVIIAVACFCPHANSFPEFLAAFEARYPNAAGITCGACKLTQNPITDFTRNPYGASIQKRYPVGALPTPEQLDAAFTFVEKLDSDGDGYTNLTEITASTAPPAGTGIKVLPGFAALNREFRAVDGFRAFPPKLLFFDNFSNAAAGTIPNWTATGGVWRGNNVSVLSPSAAGETFLIPTPPRAPAALRSFRTGSISADITLVSGNNPGAGIVFSQSATGFRFVNVSNSRISIGQVGTVGGTANNNPTQIPFNGFTNGATHNFRVQLFGGGLVRISVDGVAQTPTHKFDTAVPGHVGFRTRRTGARFDNATFSK